MILDVFFTCGNKEYCSTKEKLNAKLKKIGHQRRPKFWLIWKKNLLD